MNPLLKYLGTVTAVLIAIVVVTLLFALPVMWLWNAVMPDIFNLPEIGFWQALLISMLSHCLFGRVDINKSDS